MPDFHTVCKVDDIPEGEARMFVIDGVLVGVFHINGQFHALDNECPHAGASLAHGLIEGDTVRCRIHHWRFCIRDGTEVQWHGAWSPNEFYYANVSQCTLMDDSLVLQTSIVTC